MLIKIVGTLVVSALVVLGVLWLAESIRFTKKTSKSQESKDQ